MILFKHGVDSRELARIHPKLRRLVDWVSDYCWQNWMDDIVVTSIFRTDNPSSVHAYGRGIDLATLVRGNSEELRRIVNDLHPYGDGVHETIPELRHGNAPHLHLQVMDTETREA